MRSLDEVLQGVMWQLFLSGRTVRVGRGLQRAVQHLELFLITV